jgi:hypothetical protein
VGSELIIEPATSERAAERGDEEDDADLGEEREVSDGLPVTFLGTGSGAPEV